VAVGRVRVVQAVCLVSLVNTQADEGGLDPDAEIFQPALLGVHAGDQQALATGAGQLRGLPDRQVVLRRG
jgi:hypothetical protein